MAQSRASRNRKASDIIWYRLHLKLEFTAQQSQLYVYFTLIFTAVNLEVDYTQSIEPPCPAIYNANGILISGQIWNSPPHLLIANLVYVYIQIYAIHLLFCISGELDVVCSVWVAHHSSI